MGSSGRPFGPLVAVICELPTHANLIVRLAVCLPAERGAKAAANKRTRFLEVPGPRAPWWSGEPLVWQCVKNQLRPRISTR